jgi:TolB-like protein/Tfp pilus assembly protein PilF
MEYVEGESLKDLIARKELSIGEVLDIALQISDGLAMAHQVGIVHRDIKPQNVLMGKDGRIRICDFGLAKVKRDVTLTQAGSMLGTIAYMSPEQAQGMKVDHRSDIFSFGVVLHEMITGQLPFKGGHEAAMIYSIVNETPEPLARYKATVPEGLQRIVDKAVEKNRDERYQHIDDLLADLRRERKSLEYVKTAITKPAESTKPAIAVLYLQNLSENKEDEYFAAGMTEDIITQLSKIGSLLVTSRSDVEQFKNKPVNLKGVANKLRVNYVIEGSVRKYGNKIRITCQLIKASDGFHAWADSYDRQMEDLFAIQADVAKEVAQALKVILAPSELERIEKKPTLNMQAYSYYLKGREYYLGGGAFVKELLELTIKMFEKALEEDANFALAYTSLSGCYTSYVMFQIDLKKSWLEKAEKAGLKALAIDPNLVEAYRSLARLYWVEGQTEKTIQQAEKAVKANPNQGEPWYFLGFWNTVIGRYLEAERALIKALELKPIQAGLFGAFILLYSRLGKKEKVEEYYNKGLEILPDNWWTYRRMSDYYLYRGELEEAKRMIQNCLDVQPQNVVPKLNLVEAFLMSGEVDIAFNCLNEYRRQNPNRDLFVELGYLELMRGNKKQAESYWDSCIEFNQPLIKEFEGLRDEYYGRSRMAFAYALKGELEKSLEHAEMVRKNLGASLLNVEWAMDRPVIALLSFIYSLTGQKEESVRMLEFLVKNNIITPAYIKLHPWYENLAGYPAFEELTKRKTK